MKIKNNKGTGNIYIRSLLWFFGAGLLLVGFGRGSIQSPETKQSPHKPVLSRTHQILDELDRLDILPHLKSSTVAELIDYHWQSGKTLAEIVQEPIWLKKLNLSSSQFEVTWYMENPFDFLPAKLQKEIKNHRELFRSRTHIFEWCKVNKFPSEWREALYLALIETTPINLSRASKGGKAYAKNGQFLEPIVIDHGLGNLEVRDGHIATDPKVIPTNTQVILLVQIDGVDRLLRVKAADIGGAIKGKHVDLPARLNPDSTHPLPRTRFPSALKNPHVRILQPTT